MKIRKLKIGCLSAARSLVFQSIYCPSLKIIVARLHKRSRCLDLIDHQFEVNGASSVSTVVVDVSSPSFALDVDQNAS